MLHSLYFFIPIKRVGVYLYLQNLSKYISKWFISLQRHNIKFDWFRYHLLCILLLFHLLNPQMCFIFYLSIWQRINQLNLIRLWWYQLAILTNEMPHPTLQHQPTRHRGTVIIWAKHITKFTSTQQTLMVNHLEILTKRICVDLSNVSESACHLGQPTVAGDEHLQQASTRNPDNKVPDPGQRQLRTKHNAAVLWLRIGIAPFMILSVI